MISTVKHCSLMYFFFAEIKTFIPPADRKCGPSDTIEYLWGPNTLTLWAYRTSAVQWVQRGAITIRIFFSASYSLLDNLEREGTRLNDFPGKKIDTYKTNFLINYLKGTTFLDSNLNYDSFALVAIYFFVIDCTI